MSWSGEGTQKVGQRESDTRATPGSGPPTRVIKSRGFMLCVCLPPFETKGRDSDSRAVPFWWPRLTHGQAAVAKLPLSEDRTRRRRAEALSLSPGSFYQDDDSIPRACPSWGAHVQWPAGTELCPPAWVLF